MSDEVFDLHGIVQGLRGAREQWRRSQQRSLEVGGRELPSREALAAIVEGLRGALFPMRRARPTCARKARTTTSATRWIRC